MKIQDIKKIYNINQFQHNDTNQKKQNNQESKESFEEILEQETKKLKQNTLENIISEKTFPNKETKTEIKESDKNPER